MHIVNIMFSAAGGGIQQAFVDYSEALLKRGHRVTAITHPGAVVNIQLRRLGIVPVTLYNMGEWDVFAVLRLRKLLGRIEPDIVLTHTSRSFALVKPALQRLCPLVGIAHNYNGRVARMTGADAVFATTHDLVHFLKQCQIPDGNIHHIPNMVNCQELPRRGGRNKPLIIGAMGRFVEKKGFHIYIEALRILKERGYYFKAVLAGGGEEQKHLEAQAQAAGLRYILSFPGWVHDKAGFFTHLDIFCLPSLHEPFGIVLLESFTYGTPVVATDTEGPADIITPAYDALIVRKNNAVELADTIARLMDDPELAASLAANSFVKAKTVYSIDVVARRIEHALELITGKWKNQQHRHFS